MPAKKNDKIVPKPASELDAVSRTAVFERLPADHCVANYLKMCHGLPGETDKYGIQKPGTWMNSATGRPIGDRRFIYALPDVYRKAWFIRESKTGKGAVPNGRREMADTIPPEWLSNPDIEVKDTTDVYGFIEGDKSPCVISLSGGGYFSARRLDTQERDFAFNDKPTGVYELASEQRTSADGNHKYLAPKFNLVNHANAEQELLVRELQTMFIRHRDRLHTNDPEASAPKHEDVDEDTIPF